MTKGSCNLCGRCCEAIALRDDWTRLENYQGGGDRGFVAKHWKPISKEEATKVNAYLLSNPNFQAYNFYTCDWFDKEKRICSHHEERPSVCRDYPWYGGQVRTDEVFYSEDCGYKIDRERQRVIEVLRSFLIRISPVLEIGEERSLVTKIED